MAKVLVKNFAGAWPNIDTLISLLQGVNGPPCRLILDWGNTHFASIGARLAEFPKAFPDREMATMKGIAFDQNYRPGYDPAAMIAATGNSGFRVFDGVVLGRQPTS